MLLFAFARCLEFKRRTLLLHPDRDVRREAHVKASLATFYRPVRFPGGAKRIDNERVKIHRATHDRSWGRGTRRANRTEEKCLRASLYRSRPPMQHAVDSAWHRTSSPDNLPQIRRRTDTDIGTKEKRSETPRVVIAETWIPVHPFRINMEQAGTIGNVFDRKNEVRTDPVEPPLESVAIHRFQSIRHGFATRFHPMVPVDGPDGNPSPCFFPLRRDAVPRPFVEQPVQSNDASVSCRVQSLDPKYVCRDVVLFFEIKEDIPILHGSIGFRSDIEDWGDLSNGIHVNKPVFFRFVDQTAPETRRRTAVFPYGEETERTRIGRAGIGCRNGEWRECK